VLLTFTQVMDGCTMRCGAGACQSAATSEIG